MSLFERRVVCPVTGRGGACQSRIHSRGATDLDSASPGGEGVGVNTFTTGGGEKKEQSSKSRRD